MRFDVPLVSAGLIGAATASWIPSSKHQDAEKEHEQVDGYWRQHHEGAGHKRPHIAPHWGYAQKAPSAYESDGSVGPLATGSSNTTVSAASGTAPVVTTTVQSTVYECETLTTIPGSTSTEVVPVTQIITVYPSAAESDAAPVTTAAATEEGVSPPAYTGVDGEEDVTSTEAIVSYITSTSYSTRTVTFEPSTVIISSAVSTQAVETPDAPVEPATTDVAPPAYTPQTSAEETNAEETAPAYTAPAATTAAVATSEVVEDITSTIVSDDMTITTTIRATSTQFSTEIISLVDSSTYAPFYPSANNSAPIVEPTPTAATNTDTSIPFYPAETIMTSYSDMTTVTTVETDGTVVFSTSGASILEPSASAPPVVTVSGDSNVASSSGVAVETPAFNLTSTVEEAATSAPVAESTSAAVEDTTSAASTTSAPVAESTSVAVEDTTSAASTTSAESTTSASSTTSSASASATAVTSGDCQAICSDLTFSSPDVKAWSCSTVAANTETDTAPMQASVGCAATFTPPLDICRVTMTIATSDQTTTYMEVFLPSGEDWNGRIMNSDNGGVNGCVHYVDMTYVLGKGFAVVGDNGGHNSSSFDGTAFIDNNDAVVDWSYRSRHEAAVAGKEVVNGYYSNEYSYSYYLGCSTGGRQGLKSAQEFPSDFDGIIAGSSAADFNNLEYWTGRFVQYTGLDESDARFLTFPQWQLVHSSILEQCDAALDGVDDGILEDPTLCMPTFESITCDNSDDANCLSSTQLETVGNVYSPATSPSGDLLFPRMQPGSEIDAWKLGVLSGAVQGIVKDWFAFAVLGNDSFDALDLTYADLQTAQAQDEEHGFVSSYDSDLSGLEASGSKLLMYHGMADPSITGLNSQRYYLDVARTMGYGSEQLDNFFRFFRISGQAHCSIGGISGDGAWEIGQSAAGSAGEGNVIDSIVDWVENGNAPDTIVGTKFVNDNPSDGTQMVRPHCRFPYRTTYNGGDASTVDGWDCVLIQDWQTCDGSNDGPQLC